MRDFIIIFHYQRNEIGNNLKRSLENYTVKSESASAKQICLIIPACESIFRGKNGSVFNKDLKLL
jgi:hypothetical protein